MVRIKVQHGGNFMHPQLEDVTIGTKKKITGIGII